MGNKKEQLLFIHRLRGIAACMVLFWHLGVMFWMANEVVAAAFPLKGFPEASAKLPYIVSHIYRIIFKYGVDFGMFGVALFFLISGYIIPYSLRGGALDRKEKFLFLGKRILRIYPTYICGFSILFLCLWTYAKVQDVVFPYSFRDYLVQASLLRDWFWAPTIDGVSWTLEIELKFYVIVFLLLLFNKLQSRKTIVVLGISLTLFNVVFNAYASSILLNNIRLYQIFSILEMDFHYIIFMLWGLVLYHYEQKKWTGKQSLMVFQILFLCFWIAVLNGSQSAMTQKFAINYMGAALLFFDFYLMKNEIKNNRIFDFIADRSYAIYILHGGTGYAILSVLCEYGCNAILSFCTTVGIILVISVLFHKYIEQNLNRLTNEIVVKIKSKWA